jgi:hypothetical protein
VGAEASCNADPITLGVQVAPVATLPTLGDAALTDEGHGRRRGRSLGRVVPMVEGGDALASGER